jgi:hypothetical protein
VDLYMQPVRVYKVSCLLLQVGVLGLAGFMYILRVGLFLAVSGYAKSEDPVSLSISLKFRFLKECA